MNQYIVADSGERQSFNTGMVRDSQDDKPRPDLISPFAVRRIGEHLRKGAIKYTARNWEKGGPYSRFWASLTRHVLAWQSGEREEDHLAAICFNAMAIMHFEELGRIELDDMPRYYHVVSRAQHVYLRNNGPDLDINTLVNINTVWRDLNENSEGLACWRAEAEAEEARCSSVGTDVNRVTTDELGTTELDLNRDVLSTPPLCEEDASWLNWAKTESVKHGIVEQSTLPEYFSEEKKEEDEEEEYCPSSGVDVSCVVNADLTYLPMVNTCPGCMSPEPVQINASDRLISTPEFLRGRITRIEILLGHTIAFIDETYGFIDGEYITGTGFTSRVARYRRGYETVDEEIEALQKASAQPQQKLSILEI